MKYINKFPTNADYQAFTEGGGYVTPNICYITELKGLKFKPKVNNSGGSEESSFGDVAYYTNGEIKTVAITKWNTSLGTPIGVVVIPSNFLPDGNARILSLKAVDSSGNTTTSHSSMYWGPFGTDTTLTNYIMVPITDNTSSTSSSYDSYGHLPSDNFTGSTSFVDSSANYNSSYLIPSPYNGNEFNTDYSKKTPGNNALSDFNGLSNTQVLVGLGSDYTAANAAWKYNDGVSNIQWYLPSMGELGFMVARFKAINNTILQLGGVVVPSADDFWSSTESSSSNAYYLDTDGGVVNNYGKNYVKFYVRPFALLGNNNSGSNSGDSINLITFTVDGVQYQAEEGMTWEEWRYSEYNTDNLIVLDSNSSFVYKNNQSTQFILNTNDYVWVLKNDSIIDNKSYIFIAPGAGN